MRLPLRLRSFKDERGIALVMALGILTVFGISVVTLIDYTTSNTQASANNGARQTAYSLAEAGINDMYGILSKQANNAFSSSLLPSCSSPTTIAYDKGWASYCGSLPSGSAAVIAVSTRPGATTLAVMPRVATSRATLRVSPSKPALAEA